MARLNVRPSSRYNSETPGPADTSDQENQDPRPQRMDKGKGRASDVALPPRANPPTPTSESSSEAHGRKRKRGQPQPRAIEFENGEEDEEAREAAKFNKYFDPNQDPDERREVKRKSRALEREFHENRDDLLKGDSGEGLTKTIQRANRVFKDVKQTNDATLDSRLLVDVSDLAFRKTQQLVLGDTSTGIDVDEFLSKCITHMRRGNERGDQATSNSRRPRTQTRNDSDDEEDDDATGALDWDYLGRNACFPYNNRPCVPSFLLGPLSVEKKQRTQTQRRARQSKDTAGREARPEALSREDLSRSDENGLTAICARINTRLLEHIQDAEERINEEGWVTDSDDLQTERGKALLKSIRLSDTGFPSLFDFVLNPHSFGQTVENLFYVSFLIKEGAVGVEMDSEGLPTLAPVKERSLEEQRKNRTVRRQAVFSLDYTTWHSLVEAFDVKQPLIEHRQEDDGAAHLVRGWYT